MMQQHLTKKLLFLPLVALVATLTFAFWADATPAEAALCSVGKGLKLTWYQSPSTAEIKVYARYTVGTSTTRYTLGPRIFYGSGWKSTTFSGATGRTYQSYSMNAVRGSFSNVTKSCV